MVMPWKLVTVFLDGWPFGAVVNFLVRALALAPEMDFMGILLVVEAWLP